MGDHKTIEEIIQSLSEQITEFSSKLLEINERHLRLKTQSCERQTGVEELVGKIIDTNSKKNRQKHFDELTKNFEEHINATTTFRKECQNLGSSHIDTVYTTLNELENCLTQLNKQCKDDINTLHKEEKKIHRRLKSINIEMENDRKVVKSPRKHSLQKLN